MATEISVTVVQKLELDKDKKYLLFISNDKISTIRQFCGELSQELKKLGYDCIIAVVPDETKIKAVIQDKEKHGKD